MKYPNRAKRALRNALMLDLYGKGLTVFEIASQVNVDITTVHNVIKFHPDYVVGDRKRST